MRNKLDAKVGPVTVLKSHLSPACAGERRMRNHEGLGGAAISSEIGFQLNGLIRAVFAQPGA